MKKRLFAISLCLLALLLSPVWSGASASESDEYIELREGMNGDAVRQLQARLALLGFYFSEVDGDYGKLTVEAVQEAESYLQILERMEYDGVVLIDEPETGATAEPSPNPEADATAEIEPFVPTIIVDGIADVDLLSILYDDSVDWYSGEVTLASKGAAVRRVQSRLVTLNYLSGKPDGEIGLTSLAALKKFQSSHGLEATGKTNAQTRALLYSEDAIRALWPVYNQLAEGAQSDVVRSLQERMWQLGFMTNRVDGAYGPSTKKAVISLQEYLFSIEHPDYPKAVEGASADQIGFTANGVADSVLLTIIIESDFPIYRETISAGSTNTQEVQRLQRRLYALEYLAGTNPADGDYGAATQACVKEFQMRNSLPETGIADEATQRAMYNDEAILALKPYLIKVSLDNQKVYVFTPDENEDFTVLYKTFVCSTGLDATPTPSGTFRYTSPGTNEWHYFSEFKSWAHYPFYIEGDIMFHSVLYNDKDDLNSLQIGTVKNLGKKASHGCVRLTVEDAKWIWENCPKRTMVIIY